jgi:hypothetical protein
MLRNMIERDKFIFTVMLVSSLALPASIFAQSGRNLEPGVTSTVPPKQETQTPTSSNTNLEKVKLILSNGFENFVKGLNENGKLGYRLEKSVSYGGQGVSQSYAAVLRLDAGNTYDYDWVSSPDKNLLDLRLNYEAKKGFNYVNAFALTFCSEESEDTSDPSSRTLSMLHFLKGHAFLVERKNGSTDQTKEYTFFTAKMGPGKNPKESIQAALDTAPQGFRPVKILLSKSGLLDFRVSVLLEKNLSDANPAKIEYRFVKEISGFDKAVNTLAAQGFRFVAGRRIGLIKFALMAKQANDATAYSFIDDDKYAKEFDKTIAQGKVYYGVMEGDLTCDATEVVNQKLVFTQNPNGEKHEYKIFKVFNAKTGNQTAVSLAEFQRLLGENYHVKDLFYSDGLNVILEK